MLILCFFITLLYYFIKWLFLHFTNFFSLINDIIYFNVASLGKILNNILVTIILFFHPIMKNITIIRRFVFASNKFLHAGINFRVNNLLCEYFIPYANKHKVSASLIIVPLSLSCILVPLLFWVSFSIYILNEKIIKFIL